MASVRSTQLHIAPDGAKKYLWKQFQQSSAGAGRLIMVSGGIASGKTVLQEELLDEAAGAGALTLSATGARDEQHIGAAVIDQLLTNSSLPIEIPSTFAWPGSGAAAPDGPDEYTGSRLVRDVCDTLLGLARTQPIVIGVDDLHFADETSLKLLSQLQRRIRRTRLMIVLTQPDWQHSPTRLSSHFARQPRFQAVQLAPLPPRSIARLLQESPDGTADAAADEVAGRIHVLSAGNPLLVHALAEDYRDSGARRQVAAGPAYSAAVHTLLERPDTQLLDVASAVAVLGRHSSDVPLIAKLTGIDPDTVTTLLGALQQAGLLVDGAFRHPAAGTAVLNVLTPSARTQLHAAAAELKYRAAATATDVATHLITAADASATWSVPLLRTAAEQAMTADDVQFATQCLELALNATEDEQERRALRQSIARSLFRVNPSAVNPYAAPLREAVLDGVSDHADCFAVMRHALWQGDRQTYLRARTALLATGEPVDPQTMVELDLAYRWHFGPRPATAGDDGTRPGGTGAKGTEGPGAPGTVPQRVTPWSHTADTLLRMWRQRGDGATIAGAERILRNCRLGDTALEAIAMAISALVRAGRVDSAERWCVTLSREAHQRSAVTWEAMLVALRADIVLRRGDVACAEDRARAALDMLGDQNWGASIVHPLSTLLMANIAAGNLEEAARTLKRPVPTAAFSTLGGLQYLRAWGHFHLATNRPLAAVSLFQRCEQVTRGWDQEAAPLVPWRSDLAEANLQLGNVSMARDLARQQVKLAVDTDPHACGLALRVLAMAAAPQESAGISSRAATYFREAGHQLELDRTLKLLERARPTGQGVADRTAGRRDGERPVRAAGVPEQRRVMMPRAPGRDLMVKPAQVTGRTDVPVREPERVRDRDAERDRQDAGESTVLSEAELRVAHLAALGHTNRQISSALFITVSTVEQHLTRAYRKLGISGRSALANKLSLRQPELAAKNGGSF
uniref:LuxR-family transcriptional regulator n=1 Tax=Streptomyces sp. ML694-90F3 TaxID=1265536 RepID=A0A077KSU8_9ACTN|nr:LuxR-family transcriptional regulator [Streptomyces sp. ML694-90F3]